MAPADAACAMNVRRAPTIIGSLARPSSTQAARERITAWMGTLADLEGAERLLDWDRETLMPPPGAAARGHVTATLRALRHRELVRPGIAEDLAAASDASGPDGPERAILRLAVREVERARRLPEDLVRASSQAASDAVAAWLACRPRADFAGFAPRLARVVELARQTGEALEIGAEPYDGLLDDYEPGMTTGRLEELFAEIRRVLTGIVDGVEPAPSTPPAFAGRRFDDAAQLQVARDVASLVGFDLEAGVVGLSAHPFTDSPHAGDVRFTTRPVADDPTANVLVAMHEVGHALYAQNLDPALERTLAHRAPSLGADESQSRFFENHVGRRRAFWEAIHPLLERRLGSAMDGLGPDALHAAVTRVARGWCRVDADEVTYDLHILLRFELELALIRGDLLVGDLPDAWRERMRGLLGVTPTDDAQGCMQDIHWAWAMFGYFPTYTLGNVYAAQLAAALEQELGPLDETIRAGAFDRILGFMRERVHRPGATLATDDLMLRATGTAFDTGPFLARIRALAGAAVG
jgi:carboxypeptidase Taq